MKLNVTVGELRAALLAAAKKDVRHYFAGVLVETDVAGGALVGTDGYRLHVVRCYDADGIAGEPVIVPREAAETVTKGGAGIDGMRVEIKTVDGALTLTRADGLAMTTRPVDGTYPDWRRVVPRADCPDLGKPAPFDPAFLADAATAARYVGAPKRGRNVPWVEYRGEGASVVTVEGAPTFAAVVMPERFKAVQPTSDNCAIEYARGGRG